MKTRYYNHMTALFLYPYSEYVFCDFYTEEAFCINIDAEWTERHSLLSGTSVSVGLLYSLLNLRCLSGSTRLKR